MSQVERRHLAALSALGACSSFAAAAELLFVTPSTVAESLRYMEKLVGQPLVERSRTGYKLNSQGEIVAELARRALNQMDEVVNHARQSMMIEADSLALLTTPTLAESFASDLVFELWRANPRFRLEIAAPRRAVIADIAHAVVAGQADIGITEAIHGVVDGAISVPLGRERVLYAFPGGSMDRPRTVTAKHLAKHGLIVVPHFESSSIYPELRARSSAVDSWVRARVAHRHAFVDLALAGVAGFFCSERRASELRGLGLHVAGFARPIYREFVTFARNNDRRRSVRLALEISQGLAQHANAGGDWPAPSYK